MILDDEMVMTREEKGLLRKAFKEDDAIRARIAELERVLLLAKRAVYEGIGTHREFCEQGEKCEGMITMREAIAEIESVLWKASIEKI